MMNRRVTMAIASSLLALAAVGTASAVSVAPGHHSAPVTATTPQYPQGTPDSSEPSKMAPPSATALDGFSLDYVNDFDGSSVPKGWYVYSGVPGSDPGGQFGPGHVSVRSGLLELSTWSDPAYDGEWVTGGLCQCGLARTYGAYFVRTRLTGPGPTSVELLWPSARVWPPEVDFSETWGGVTSTTATVHFNQTNKQDGRKVTINMMDWHTFGVVWTPGELIYLVDGRVWGTVARPSEVPSIPMTLDLQQQTWCLSAWACPASPQAMLVDWVAEYNLNGPVTVNIGSFAKPGSRIPLTVSDDASALAADVATLHCPSVALTGYAPANLSVARSQRVSSYRANLVRTMVLGDLARRKVSGVSVTATGEGWPPTNGSLSPSDQRALGTQVIGRACGPSTAASS